MTSKRKVSNPLALAVMALLYERLIEPRETVREGRRPERTVYGVTGAGREEFLAWLRELLREPVKEYTQFAAGLLFLAGLPPEEAVALLREWVRRLESENEEMRSRLDTAMEQLNLPRLFLVESEHELMLRETELGWVRRLVEEIETGKLGSLSEWRSLHSGRTRRALAGVERRL